MKEVPNEQFTEEEKRDDDRRVRFLKRLVDFSLALIAQSDITPEESRRMVEAVRLKAVELFPGKEAVFELIYTPRFRRVIAEKYGLQ